MTQSLNSASLSIVWLVFSSQPLPGQLIIDQDQTVDGTTLTIDPPHGLFVTDADNDPLLTLTNGANTVGVEGLVIGLLSGESGNLLIEGGSVVTNSGSGSLGTWGSQTVQRGSAYLGLNADSTGIATVTGAGSLWTNTGSLLVGNAGTGILNITDGGQVTSQLGDVGVLAGSTGTVNINGTGSQWLRQSNSTEFNVGRSGTGTLNLTDGGRMVNFRGNVGRFAGSSGTVTVSGTGSEWINTDWLTIGWDGDASVFIQNGGRIESDTGDIAFGSTSNSSVTVSGSGSTWINNDYLNVADAGVGSLTIADQGFVSNTRGYLGFSSGSIGTATVTGPGSEWQNNDFFIVGTSGTGFLNVLDGGIVSTTAYGHIGRFAGGNGTILVSGAGSTFTTGEWFQVGTFGTGTLTISDGGTVQNVGYAGIGTFAGVTGTATVQDAGSEWNIGTQLNVGWSGVGNLDIINGGQVVSQQGFIGREAGSVGLVEISGSGSSWTTSHYGVVGSAGEGTLSITSGGQFSSVHSRVGYLVNSAQGTVLISGAGSVWTTQDSLEIGTHGTGTLNIENGGAAYSNWGGIGYFEGSSGTVNISGPNSVWEIQAEGNTFDVGRIGQGTLNISNGGRVSNLHGHVAVQPDSIGTVTVSGAGSVWDNEGWLTIGWLGNGSLAITDGGTVNSSFGFIGRDAGSFGTVNVSGAGSEWNNDGTWFLVGWNGNANLSVSDGGSVNSFGGIVAFEVGSTGNVTISGVDSIWNVEAGLSVGWHGNGVLEVNDGGQLFSLSETNLGVFHSSEGTITIKDAESVLTSTGPIYVGRETIGILNIENGGIVNATSSTASDIGVFANSNGTVNVRDSGSQWNITSALGIGRESIGVLNIEDGGVVVNQAIGNVNSAIGVFVGGEGTVNVTGAGSLWDNQGNVNVGWDSVGILNISDSGRVENQQGVVGRNFGSNGTVNVSGLGSEWNNEATLTIGWIGNGLLDITNGGSVTNADSYIGRGAGSDGSVRVTGENSSWTMESDIWVGSLGTGSLTIENGGVVVNNAIVFQDSGIGVGSGGIGAVVVDGLGSLWLNQGNLAVGWSGSGSLQVSNGGRVENSQSTIGESLGSTGTATIAGHNSTWEMADSLSIGPQGTGYLNVVDGGQVSSLTGQLGWLAGSFGRATIADANSSWHNENTLNVGGSGVGQLILTEGGQVTTNHLIIGQASGLGGGLVDVVGALTGLTVRSDLIIGQNGSGVLDMWDGSSVSADRTFVAQNVGSSGFLYLEGTGSSFSTNELYIGGDQSQSGGFGEVYVGAGTTLSVSDRIEIYENGIMFIDEGNLIVPDFTVDGELAGNGIINANVIINGMLAPGSSAGTIGIDGSLTLNPTSVVCIEIGGTSPGTGYDLVDGLTRSPLIINESRLMLSLIDDFMPDEMDEFDFFVNFTSITGRFQSGPGLFGDQERIYFEQGSFGIQYVDNGIRLFGFQAIPEPSVVVLASVFFGLGLIRRKRII